MKGLRDDILILTFQLTARPLSSIAHILAEGHVVPERESVLRESRQLGGAGITRRIGSIATTLPATACPASGGKCSNRPLTMAEIMVMATRTSRYEYEHPKTRLLICNFATNIRNYEAVREYSKLDRQVIRGSKHLPHIL
ncbi:hypothetical protein V1478_003042 [Vespula squamosa]|uniref:Uncharacterized protein n=1 Tax=Vespula squamosa TaxID=30214 RepID=A0ABD2BRK1_VESSQ